MKLTESRIIEIIREEIDATLSEKEAEKEFEAWDDDQAESTWESMGGSFDKVKQSASKFAKDPAAYAASLHKRVVGKWPSERK